jgi:hypothetical protein
MPRPNRPATLALAAFVLAAAVLVFVAVSCSAGLPLRPSDLPRLAREVFKPVPPPPTSEGDGGLPPRPPPAAPAAE